MKQMILTGLDTELSFDKKEPCYHLIFNNGELRVQVTEEAANAVIAAMYAAGQTNGHSHQEEVEDDSWQASEELLDEDGIGQV